MNILGIETSCDETAAAIVRDGREVLSSVVYSQVDLHSKYGGVVPEIASRCHVEMLPGVIDECMRVPGLTWADVDAVAVTYGPGLATSLIVGVSAAKGLALRLNKPVYAINHLEAHIYAIFLGQETGVTPDDMFPFISLVVSGGHTCLVRVTKLGGYTLLGQTVDDAAGEAFDKGANLLGLGYPGGPAIERASKGGNPVFFSFPRGRQKADKGRFPWLHSELCYSFSGVKTALLYYLKKHPEALHDGTLASIAASYQEAIVDALVKKCGKAVRDERYISAGGGVSINSRLRASLAQLAESKGVRLILADPEYCRDNAAMVAGLAGAGQGITGDAGMNVDVQPDLGIG